MLPRVDLPEVILEVMSWEPGSLVQAFTAVSGGRSRLEDLPVPAGGPAGLDRSVPGRALHEHRSRPVAKQGVPALERSRLSHVFQNYFRPETLAPANVPLVTRQAGGCARAGVGWRHGRRGRWDAVRRPGPGRVRRTSAREAVVVMVNVEARRASGFPLIPLGAVLEGRERASKSSFLGEPLDACLPGLLDGRYDHAPCALIVTASEEPLASAWRPSPSG